MPASTSQFRTFDPLHFHMHTWTVGMQTKQDNTSWLRSLFHKLKSQDLDVSCRGPPGNHLVLSFHQSMLCAFEGSCERPLPADQLPSPAKVLHVLCKGCPCTPLVSQRDHFQMSRAIAQAIRFLMLERAALMRDPSLNMHTATNLSLACPPRVLLGNLNSY